MCTFVHRLFITQPQLIRAMHLQTYHPQLIPIVVSGVSSMHVCLDYLPELLGQAQLSKQVFGMILGTRLIRKYPIAKRYCT